MSDTTLEDAPSPESGLRSRRTAVSLDQITAAAERVRQQIEGGSREDVSVRAVHAALGRHGSFETIGRALRVWKTGGQPKAEPRIELLPEDEARIRDFAVLMLSVVTERSQVQHQKIVDDLTKSAEDSEKEVARILAEMQEQDDELQAIKEKVESLGHDLLAQQGDNEGLRSDLAVQTSAAETARRDLAHERERADRLEQNLQAERDRAARAEGTRDQALSDLKTIRAEADGLSHKISGLNTDLTSQAAELANVKYEHKEAVRAAERHLETIASSKDTIQAMRVDMARTDGEKHQLVAVLRAEREARKNAETTLAAERGRHEERLQQIAHLERRVQDVDAPRARPPKGKPAQ